MKCRMPIVVFFLGLAISNALVAQSDDENSIAEPTRLGGIASDPATEIIAVGESSSLESDRAIANFTTVEFSLGAERERGFRLALEYDDDSDLLYLDYAQAAQLRDELAGFDGWRERACGGARNCVFGVARCRPSQSVRQAFCPSIYRQDGEVGVSISTPGNVYPFPSLDASELADAIAAVMSDAGIL